MQTEKKRLYSPEIDNIVERFGSSGFENFTNNYQSQQVARILHRLFEVIQPIKPKIASHDKIWSLWICSERGPRSAFMTDAGYEEMKEMGEIGSQDDLESLWKSYYPGKMKWHEVSFVHYENKLFLRFDTRLQVQFNLATGDISGADLNGDEQIQFLSWLQTAIENEVARFVADPNGYNQFINKNLPLHKRYGKIKRMILWENVDDMIRFDEQFGQANLEKFERVVESIKEENLITEMTADDFFRYCEICYDANDYFKDSLGLSPGEKYRKMADGRDDGLLEVQRDSQQAFEKWHKERTRIGHPWEICRGGNETHISLMVHRDNTGWKLYLAGSSRVRAMETAKMAIALFEHNVPFILIDAEPMLQMLKGEDLVGIVPEDVVASYCQGYFPKEDRIHDCINPWHDEDFMRVVEKHAEWYPLEEFELNN